MIIRKNDYKVFLIIYCINIKTLLILINYQKGHTILIKKNGMINKKTWEKLCSEGHVWFRKALKKKKIKENGFLIFCFTMKM